MDGNEFLEYQKNLYLQLSWICLGHVEAKRKGNAKKAEKMLSKILAAGADADTSTFEAFLHSDKFDPGYGASVKQALKELSSNHYFRSHNVEYDFDLESSLSQTLKNSWLDGVDKYVYLYQQSCRKLERVKQEEKENLNSEEASFTEGDSYSSHSENYSKKEDKFQSHTNFLNFDEKEEVTQELHGSILDILDEMFERWQRDPLKVKLTSGDFQFFEKHFGGLSFDYENTIKNGIRMKSLFDFFNYYATSQKNVFGKCQDSPSIAQLLELADIISKEVPKELLRDHDRHGEAAIIDNQILGKIDIHHALEKYQDACDIYKKYYESLSDGDKEFEKRMFQQSVYLYENLHLDHNQFEIVSFEKLTSIVNEKVANEMVSNSTKFQTASIQAISSITKATKYMSPEMVADVYRAIQQERSKHVSQSDQSKKQDCDLQYNFSKAIAARLHHEAISPKEERKLLDDVCREYFNEELKEGITEEFLSTTLQVFARDGVLSTNPARVTNESQIYGIHKLQRTLSKVNGTYHKLETLREQKIETRTDQMNVSSELERMLNQSQGGKGSGKRL